MRDLKNKNILITGGARGIGKQIAIDFAKCGANIVICDLNELFFEEKLFKEQTKEIEVLGVSCFGYHLDVTDINNIIEVRKKILSEVGKIDVLVNNAGVVFGGRFLEVSIKQHRLTYDVNTQGIVNMLHVFLGDLIKQNAAHIVNIASASGFTSLPGGATYASSKAAVTSFSESLYIELKKDGYEHVGMTIVCPAYVNTGMFDGVKEPTFIPMLTVEKLSKKIVRAVVCNRLFVLEPIFIKFIPFMKAVFPRFIFEFLGNILGGFNSMDLWKGHSKK